MKHTEIKTVKQLSNYLRCSDEFLTNAIRNEFKIIDNKDNKAADINVSSSVDIEIEKIYIKKKGKSSGFRIVHAIITSQLENTLKILNNYLNEIFTPESSVHGFVPGKSIKTNATLHLGKKLILSVDIENYFESISIEMISHSLVQIGFDKEVANWISCITSTNGHLVQGFNTSPTLANIVTHQMDKELAKFCGEKIKYTRYADDLYFSSNEFLPDLADVKSIISKFGFKLNHKKTKEMKRGSNQYVTGLTVFDKFYPRIPKRIKRNLRLEVYYIKKYGYAKHAIRRLKNSGLKIHNTKEFQYEIEQEIVENSHRLFGWIHYINSIEPSVGRKLYSKLIGAMKYYP